MKSPYLDPIRDLLADGCERTVEEICVSIHAEPGARIHHVLRLLADSIAIERGPHKLTSRRIGRILYWKLSGVEVNGRLNGRLRSRHKGRLSGRLLKRPSRSKLPWDKVSKGRGFVVNGKSLRQVSSMACKAEKRTGRKFVCRSKGEGVRVLRVA